MGQGSPQGQNSTLGGNPTRGNLDPAALGLSQSAAQAGVTHTPQRPHILRPRPRHRPVVKAVLPVARLPLRPPPSRPPPRPARTLQRCRRL